MRFRYKSILFIIVALIGLCISLFAFHYVYYNYIYDKAVVVVDGTLTINYLNGNKFKGKNDMQLNFSVTNNGSEEASFYIRLANVKAIDTQYTLKKENSNLMINENLASSIVSTQLLISGNTTENYELDINSINKEPYSGELIIAMGNKESTTWAQIIKDNNNIKKESKTTFAEKATKNEGLIERTTDEGKSYYFRGNVTNNYVSFADYTWRIVGINEDESVKLVLDSIISTRSAYQDNNTENYTDSKISTILNDFYDENLSSYSSQIAVNKFCNDVVSKDGKYLAFDRLNVNFIPNNMCLGTELTLNIGLLTADEVVFAGANNEENTDYYLYNSNIKESYYTMTAAKKETYYYPYIVKSNGALAFDTPASTVLGVRPVINIIKNIKSTGKGTAKDPYILMDI